MQVHLTFDIEVWCNGWDDLDGRFAASFERYCYGNSTHGSYALPKTLEIMNRHGIIGVFFVEPLFSARFGARHLDTVTRLIADAGQDIQLHLHAEWADELDPPPIADAARKRQHLTMYTLARKRQHLTMYTQDEQAELIGHGRKLLEAATGRPVTAFRAGSFAANRDTYAALRRQGILVDSSLNAMVDFSGGSIDAVQGPGEQRVIEGVTVYPITVFRDGFGRARPAQVGASSFDELSQAMHAARAAGCRHFVIVSHNFEMLKPGSSEPDWIVVRRFERLCAWLQQQGDLFEVGPLPQPHQVRPVVPIEHRVRVSGWSTAVRHVEQLRRRLG